MAVRFDNDALRQGVAVALAVSIPIAVAWRLTVSDDDRPWWTLLFSLGVLVGLYLALGVVDFVLMRRYANPGRTEPPPEELPEAAVAY